MKFVSIIEIKVQEMSKRLSPEEFRDEILKILYKSEIPMLNMTEIAKQVGVTPQTISKYLFRMLPEDLNEYVSGMSKLYFLTDRGKVAAKELIEKEKL